MILKGLRIGSKTRPEQDSARRTKLGEGYEIMEAWGWGGGVLGFGGNVMVWYVCWSDVKFATYLQGFGTCWNRIHEQKTLQVMCLLFSPQGSYQHDLF